MFNDPHRFAPYLIGALWLLTAPAAGQTVTLPKEVQAEPGTIAVVKAVTDCPSLRWVALDRGLSLIPPDLLRDTRAAVVMAARPGRYRLLAYGALKDVPSEPAIVTIVVGDAPPDVLVTLPSVVGKPFAEAQATLVALGLRVVSQGDTTQPVKAQTPEAGSRVPAGSVVTLTCGDPPSPAPIPGDGLRVLILYETKDLAGYPAAQALILYAQSVRDYLNARCPVGPDGKTREWRIWDRDVDASAESRLWQDALRRPRKSLPWICISNGKTGYEGPLPPDVDGTLKLLRQYGGE